MPMPVSSTRKCSRACISVSLSVETRTTTSPFSWNLRALPMRWVRFGRNRPGAPRRHAAGQLDSLGVGPFGKLGQRAFDRFNQLKVEQLEREFARFNFGKIQNIVNDRQETLRAGTDGTEDFALLRVQFSV